MCRPRPRPVPRGWWFDVALLAALAALTAALVLWPPLLRVDLAVRNWVDAHRPPPVEYLMLVFDHVGQGGPDIVLTLAVAFTLAWRLRTVRPILPAGLAPILTTASIVPFKRWTERGAPHYGPVELFSGPGHVEYPSGHVSNGVVYYGTLALLLYPYLSLTARRLLQWVPCALVFTGTTYVAYHWLTDAIGGLLLGIFLVRINLRIPWERVPLPPVLDRTLGAIIDRAHRRTNRRRPDDGRRGRIAQSGRGTPDRSTPAARFTPSR